MSDFEDRLAELERRAGIVADTSVVIPAPAQPPPTQGEVSDAEVRELHALIARLPASLLRMALTGYVNRDPATFARFAGHARLAERYPADGYARSLNVGPERESSRARPCPRCGSAPGQQCRRLNGDGHQFLKAPHRERMNRDQP